MLTSENLAKEFNDKNIYEIDYDYLREKMERVMNSTSRNKLDNAMKKLVSKLILAEAIDYESFRRQNLYSAVNGKFDGVYTEKVVQISNEMDFLLGYVKIATECAKELNPNYMPPFMFGLTQKEVKNIFNKQFESYTRRDEARHDFLNVNGLRSWKEDVEFSRADYNGKVRDYEKEAEREKGYIKETYIRKEIVKQELSDMGFWRRWFSQSRRARELKAFVKLAEKALKDVKFTKEGEKEAVADFKAPAARHDDVKLTATAVDTYYERKEPESIKNSMLEIRYRPNSAKINAHLKAAKEIKAFFDKESVPEDTKEVFNMNYKKLATLANLMKSRGSGRSLENQFASMEATMAEKYDDYAALTMKDLKDAFKYAPGEAPEADSVKEPEKEHVNIQLDDKQNAPVEPKKEDDKAIVKEEIKTK